MSDIPEDAPEHCPGTQSESAGKATPCQGCPNRQICASGGAAGPDPALEDIRQRMLSVKHKILILSGKGGVGKSTVSSLLARRLASRDRDRQIALLDIDICGPSQAKMFSAEDEQVHQSMSGWSPIFVDENLSLMSIAFLLEGADDAVVWRGPKKNGIIKQFLKDVDWGDIEYMIIDTPPGTSDEHLSIVQYLMNSTHVDGAVIVTTPQEVALQDVRKEINFCRKVKLPIIGVVENMASFVCPKCNKESTIFPPSSGGASTMCDQLGLKLITSIPLDPRVARCCDEGLDYFVEYEGSPVSNSYANLVNFLVQNCETVNGHTE